MIEICIEYFQILLTMVDVTPDGTSPSDPTPATKDAIEDEEEIEDSKPSFCLLVKTWSIYYITLTFALLAIFRFVAYSFGKGKFYCCIFFLLWKTSHYFCNVWLRYYL